MTYSLTERKRIRKSFAKRATVQSVPFLIATQLESYAAFLQAETAPERPKNEGLQAAFTSIFPISSHSGNARLEFVSFQLGEPPFDVKECQQRGLTYASPLRAKVRLVILDQSMPAESGLAALPSLRALTSSPIVLFSGMAQVRPPGVAAVVEKPARPAELLRLVRDVLDRA